MKAREKEREGDGGSDKKEQILPERMVLMWLPWKPSSWTGRAERFHMNTSAMLVG